MKISPKKKRLKAGKKTKLTVKVTNKGYRSEEEREALREVVEQAREGPEEDQHQVDRRRQDGESQGHGLARRSKARGKAKITARVSGKKAKAYREDQGKEEQAQEALITSPVRRLAPAGVAA